MWRHKKNEKAEDWSEFLQEHMKPHIPDKLFQWRKSTLFGLTGLNKHPLQTFNSLLSFYANRLPLPSILVSSVGHATCICQLHENSILGRTEKVGLSDMAYTPSVHCNENKRPHY